ncbi:MAG: methylamine utilization protein [Ignavibacteriales bacterium CG18_big_fil_WC_8_21_14_2_50_31_20]|nr:MAG: methylamine utilization protein [Ignavibacteriales bacterium CG18_big_fil_WC_8_21_14_2_50_31_20]
MITIINKVKNTANNFELIWRSFYYFIVIVLLFSGISKIVNPMPMLETMKAVFKVNESLLILAATILPIIEIGFGLMLVFNILTKKTLFAVTILFFCFFAFSVYGTIIGLNNDCGCFGNLVKSEFGPVMIIRNSGLFIIALVIAVSDGSQIIKKKLFNKVQI